MSEVFSRARLGCSVTSLSQLTSHETGSVMPFFWWMGVNQCRSFITWEGQRLLKCNQMDQSPACPEESLIKLWVGDAYFLGFKVIIWEFYDLWSGYVFLGVSLFSCLVASHSQMTHENRGSVDTANTWHSYLKLLSLSETVSLCLQYTKGFTSIMLLFLSLKMGPSSHRHSF